VEFHATVPNLDPAEPPRDTEEFIAKSKLIPAVFETLVRINDRGEVEPWLATSWTHEPARKRWVFTARTGVMLHNGMPWSPPGGVVTVPDDKSIEQILRTLAQASSAITVRGSDGALAGTGPFRVVKWSPSEATLAAHETYWAGRPYLDAVALQFGRAARDQTLDLETGKAEVVEAPFTDLKRLTQKGMRTTANAKAAVTLALVFDNPRISASLREALGLAIDRPTIQKILLQGGGESTGALLPRWLSGYSFVFPKMRDVQKAKQRAASSGPLAFSYDRQDSVLRPVAERIAVDASEAGITLRTATGPVDLTLVRLPVTASDEWAALEGMAQALKTPLPSAASPYEAEKALLENARVIPLFHLPESWAWNAQVRNWTGGWADVWIDTTEKQ
jgi:ABC-type transport system substrate-binding protein